MKCPAAMHLNKMLAFRRKWCYDKTELNKLLVIESGPTVHSHLLGTRRVVDE